MKWLPGAPVFRSALVGFLLAFSFVATAGTAFANTTDVTVNIPAGIIVVQGKTSPNAQVKIYENGNEQPTASIVANASGLFNKELPQDSVGLVDIGIEALDASGKLSARITKQVAVIAHQTSTLTVILPPTISANPSSVVFRTGTLNFTGQTVPNAEVKVTIKPSTILTTTSNSRGHYSIPLLVESLAAAGIYTYGVEVSVGAEVSDYVIAGTFVATPPLQPPIALPEQPVQEFIDKLKNTTIPAPEITSPSSDDVTTLEPIIIAGRAAPGSLITIYDNGSVIGTVVAGQDGTWQFYFSPYNESHSLYARACVKKRCSENSREVVIRRPKSAPLCQPGIRLESYRLKTTTDTPVEISGSFPHETTGNLYISWGDDSSDLFETASNGRLTAPHLYEDAGIYSGYIVVNNNRNCQTAIYFAVEVGEAPSRNSIVVLSTVSAIIIVCLLWVMLRMLPIIKS